MRHVTALTSVILIALSLVMPSMSLAERWTIDPVHSSASFSVKHMMVSDTKGVFSDVKGSVELSKKKPSESKVVAEIGVNSIDTKNEKRDGHLKSPDFLDVKKFPKMTFTSTQVRRMGPNYRIKGDLTIHGVTKPVTLKAKVTKPVKNPMTGDMVRGVHAETDLSRKAFGITWNAAMDKGGVVVGDKVKVALDLELIKKDEAAGKAAPSQTGQRRQNEEPLGRLTLKTPQLYCRASSRTRRPRNILD